MRRSNTWIMRKAPVVEGVISTSMSWKTSLSSSSLTRLVVFESAERLVSAHEIHSFQGMNCNESEKQRKSPLFPTIFFEKKTLEYFARKPPPGRIEGGGHSRNYGDTEIPCPPDFFGTNARKKRAESA